MTIVNKYFMDMTKNISFIELKKGSFINLNDYIIKDHLPLPMIIDTLIDEIKLGKIEEELNVKHLIDGIIYTLGVDFNFKYRNEYKEILYHYDSKIEEYISYKGFKFIEKENLDLAAVYFRALTNINNKNINGILNYALCLENMGMRLINNESEKKGKQFLEESTKKLETILDIDEGFSLAYYKLGYHYKYYGQILKANLIWEKFLQLDKSEERLQEIRTELQLIEDDANFEQGVYFLNSEEYDLALERLLKLMGRYKEWGHLHYLIALGYKGKGEYEKAISFLKQAMELDEGNIDIYNELGICLYTLGKLDNAIEIFNQGIRLDPNDYKTIFNRGMINLELGNLQKAVEDINLAYKLNPEDELVCKQKDVLDAYLNQ